MIKKTILTGLCILFLAATTIAAAENVYITDNGTKYHKVDCRFVRNKDALKLSKDEAIGQGYTPCARCYKEDLTILEDKKETMATSIVEEMSTGDKS